MRREIADVADSIEVAGQVGRYLIQREQLLDLIDQVPVANPLLVADNGLQMAGQCGTGFRGNRQRIRAPCGSLKRVAPALLAVRGRADSSAKAMTSI